MNRNNEVIFLRLPEQDKEAAQRAAEEDQLYISEFIREAIRLALRERARRKRREEIRNLQLPSLTDQTA